MLFHALRRTTFEPSIVKAQAECLTAINVHALQLLVHYGRSQEACLQSAEELKKLRICIEDESLPKQSEAQKASRAEADKHQSSSKKHHHKKKKTKKFKYELYYIYFPKHLKEAALSAVDALSKCAKIAHKSRKSVAAISPKDRNAAIAALQLFQEEMLKEVKGNATPSVRANDILVQILEHHCLGTMGCLKANLPSDISTKKKRKLKTQNQKIS